jgi:hypothetical protein
MKSLFCRWFGCVLVAGAVGLSGCQTADQAETGGLASVAIPGHSVAKIQQATVAVFLLNGYQQSAPLTFDKQGTGWDTAAYGDWSKVAVWIRVRVHIASPKTDDCSLSCNAYAVTDRNQASMEQERKLSHAKRSECKKILDQIKARLNAPPKTSAP